MQGLHLDDKDRLVFPDVRLEVEDRDGTIRNIDLERITEHYHRGHVSGKASAGVPDVPRLVFRHTRWHSQRPSQGWEAAPMMTDAERSEALEYFGYTPRQAHFLTLVALHGGYFLRRHFVQFTRVGHGLATVRFLAKARAYGHVRELAYGRHGSMFHLCARPVYAALGQEYNRNRPPAEWAAVVRKLMTLDLS